MALTLNLPMMGIDANQLSVMTQWENSVLPSLGLPRRRKRNAASATAIVGGPQQQRSASQFVEGMESSYVEGEGPASGSNAPQAENALSLERLEKMAKVRARLDRRSAAAVQAGVNRRALQDAIRQSVADVRVPTAESVGGHLRSGLLTQSGAEIRRLETTKLKRLSKEAQFSAYL